MNCIFNSKSTDFGYFKRVFSSIASLLLSLFLSACSFNASAPQANETESKGFKQAQQFKREGRYSDALAVFLRQTETNPNASESHLELGLLYLDHLNDPIQAIYHFRRYLEKAPQSIQAPLLGDLIRRAHIQFARQLPGDPYGVNRMTPESIDLVKKLKHQNTRLRSQVQALKKELDAKEVARNEALNQVLYWQNKALGLSVEAGISSGLDAGSQTRFYTVQPGDTLVSVSQAIYGRSDRWTDIYEANRSILDNPNALVVGQQIEIP